MKSEMYYLMMLRNLNKLKYTKSRLGIVYNDIDFKNKYHKDMEEFKRKFLNDK